MNTRRGAPPFPLGQTSKSLLSASRAAVSLCIMCYPAPKGHGSQSTQLTREEIVLQTAMPRAPPALPPRAIGRARQRSIQFLIPLCAEGGDRPQELAGAAARQRQVPSSAGFNLTKGSAQLAPPSNLFKSVDSDSSSAQEGPKRSYSVLKVRQATLPLLSLA